MKKILLILIVILTANLKSKGQDYSYNLEPNIFDVEWKNSLSEKINFITYPNPCKTEFLQFRVYRGNESEYTIRIFNSVGNIVRECKLLPSDKIEVSDLIDGIYFISAEDKDGNKITKKITII